MSPVSRVSSLLLASPSPLSTPSDQYMLAQALDATPVTLIFPKAHSWRSASSPPGCSRSNGTSPATERSPPSPSSPRALVATPSLTYILAHLPLFLLFSTDRFLPRATAHAPSFCPRMGGAPSFTLAPALDAEIFLCNASASMAAAFTSSGFPSERHLGFYSSSLHAASTDDLDVIAMSSAHRPLKIRARSVCRVRSRGSGRILRIHVGVRILAGKGRDYFASQTHMSRPTFDRSSARSRGRRRG